MLTRKQLANRWKVSGSTIGRLVLEGMPHERYGSRYRFDYQDCLDWLDDRRSVPSGAYTKDGKIMALLDGNIPMPEKRRRHRRPRISQPRGSYKKSDNDSNVSPHEVERRRRVSEAMKKSWREGKMRDAYDRKTNGHKPPERDLSETVVESDPEQPRPNGLTDIEILKMNIHYLFENSEAEFHRISYAVSKAVNDVMYAKYQTARDGK